MKHSKIKALRKFVGGYCKKGGQAVVGLFSVTESKRGGQKYSLIGGDSYGC